MYRLLLAICLGCIAPVLAASPSRAAIEIACVGESWTPEKRDYLVQRADEARLELLEGVSSFHYPFSLPLRYALDRQEKTTIPVLGFGSLMNTESASKTLSETALANRRPALAFGARRLFNYSVEKSKQYGTPDRPNARAMLNTEASWTSQDMLNGVIIDVPRDQLKALCQREVGYDLIPVVAISWDEAKKLGCENEPEFFVAYILRATDKPHLGKKYTEDSIEPFTAYYQAVKEGAAEYGPDFLDLYMQTTYLADSKTNLYKYEDNNE